MKRHAWTDKASGRNTTVFHPYIAFRHRLWALSSPISLLQPLGTSLIRLFITLSLIYVHHNNVFLPQFLSTLHPQYRLDTTRGHIIQTMQHTKVCVTMNLCVCSQTHQIKPLANKSWPAIISYLPQALSWRVASSNNNSVLGTDTDATTLHLLQVLVKVTLQLTAALQSRTKTAVVVRLLYSCRQMPKWVIKYT